MSKSELMSYTFQVKTNRGVWKPLKEDGKEVSITSRKAARNYIRNKLQFKEYKVFLDGEEIVAPTE